MVFRNYRGSSVLHRMSPVTKLFLLLVLNVLAVLFLDPLYLLPLLVLSLLLFYASGVTRTDTYRRYRVGYLLFIFALFLVLFNALFGGLSGTGKTYFILNFLGVEYPVTEGNVYAGIGAGMRFLIMALAFLVVLSTTYPRDLSNAMERLGVPRKVAYALNISLRFIPNMEREFKRVLDARRVRGDDRWDRGGFLDKLRMLIDVFPTVLANALVKAERVGLVLDTRGLSNKGTVYREYPLGRIDVAFLSFLAFLTTLYVLLWLGG